MDALLPEVHVRAGVERRAARRPEVLLEEAQGPVALLGDKAAQGTLLGGEDDVDLIVDLLTALPGRDLAVEDVGEDRVVDGVGIRDLRRLW